MSKLNDPEALEQAVSLDFVGREFLGEDGLKKLVEEDGLTGVTRKPSSFNRAIGLGTTCDDSLAPCDRAHLETPTIAGYGAPVIAPPPPTRCVLLSAMRFGFAGRVGIRP